MADTLPCEVESKLSKLVPLALGSWNDNTLNIVYCWEGSVINMVTMRKFSVYRICNLLTSFSRTCSSSISSSSSSSSSKGKGKGLPQQAEVAQGVPGRLRPRIFLTFRYGKNPQWLTPPGIDPEIVRLVAQCLNHYATPGPSSSSSTYEYCRILCSRKVGFTSFVLNSSFAFY